MLNQDSNLFLCIWVMIWISVREWVKKLFRRIEKQLYKTVVYFHMKRLFGEFLFKIGFLSALNIEFGFENRVCWTVRKWKEMGKRQS